MDSFQAGQAGAFLSSAGGRFALLSQPGPEGAAPSRQPWVRQPGRCGASRCLTGSSYSWKARYHGLSHQPAGPCHPASAMSPGAGDDSSAEGALVSRGRGFPAYFSAKTGGWAFHPCVLSGYPFLAQQPRPTEQTMPNSRPKAFGLSSSSSNILLPFYSFFPVHPFRVFWSFPGFLFWFVFFSF